MSQFKAKVIIVVRSVPAGKVVSYGQVALMAGAPRAARQVGWILHGTENEIDLPWWRVVNNAGRISIKGSRFNTPQLQRQLLEAEGLEISDLFDFDIEKYRFRPEENIH